MKHILVVIVVREVAVSCADFAHAYVHRISVPKCRINDFVFLRSLIATLAIVRLMVLASALATSQNSLSALRARARSVLFWTKPHDGDATMLLALIANFATYAASVCPYKYPIAFSHNERDARFDVCACAVPVSNEI